MNQLTYLLSIKTFFEQKNDYISAFSYVILQVLNRQTQNRSDIQDKITKKFNLRMPLPVIKTCLARLKNLGITSRTNAAVLTELGEKLLQEIEKDIENANREVNSLVTKIQQFLKTKDIKVQNSAILDTLINLIESKTQDIAVGFKNIHIDEQNEENSILLKQVVHFLIDVEESDPISFNILRDIAQGVIINNILKKGDFDKLNQSFSDLTIFLDTNVIFGLLDIADPEMNVACKELVELIHQHKHISLKIFPFTIDEVHNFITSCLKHRGEHYPFTLRGSRRILSNMSVTDVQILLGSFEKKLNKNFGITVVRDYSLDLTTPDQLNSLEQVKTDNESTPNVTHASLFHDINAIQWIARLRKCHVYQLESSIALFLTLDQKLFRWSIQQHSSSMSEIITVDALTAVLWIKKPDLTSILPIHNLIAGCREKIVIRENVWDKLLLAIKDIKKIEHLEPEDIKLLQTKNILEQVEGLNDITPQEARQYIEESANTISEERKGYIKEISMLKEEKLEQEKEQKQTLFVLNKYERRNKNISKVISWIVLFFLLSFVLGLSIFVYKLGYLGNISNSIDLSVIGLQSVPRKTMFFVAIVMELSIFAGVCHKYKIYSAIQNWVFDKLTFKTQEHLSI